MAAIGHAGLSSRLQFFSWCLWWCLGVPSQHRAGVPGGFLTKQELGFSRAPMAPACFGRCSAPKAACFSCSVARRVLNKEDPGCCFHCRSRNENGGTDGTCPAQPGNAELGTRSARPDAVTLLGLGANVNLLPQPPVSRLSLPQALQLLVLQHVQELRWGHSLHPLRPKGFGGWIWGLWGVEGSDVMGKRICAFDERAGLSLLRSSLWWLPVCWGQTLVSWLTASPALRQHELTMEWKLSMASERNPALYKCRGLKCSLFSQRNENKTFQNEFLGFFFFLF